MRSRIWIPCAIALSFALGMVVQSARGSRSEKDEPRVTGIGGFFFKAQNPAKLAEWYRVHLDIVLAPAGKGENAPQFSMFEWREKDHPDRLGLTVWSIFPADTKYFEPSKGSFMMNFRVANLDRVLGQLRQEGVKVDDKIDDESNGRFGWVMDPEGNRIELWEPKGQ
jgi:catechol 2,3-dioxygenase-like lactoylglutathione lyase family enzyme